MRTFSCALVLEEMEERHVAALSSAQQQQQHLVCKEENCLQLLSSPKLDSIDMRWLVKMIVSMSDVSVAPARCHLDVLPYPVIVS